MGKRAPKKASSDRLGMRLSADLKHSVEQAARLKGVPTAGYVKTVLAAAAAKDIQEHEFLQLTFRDREAFARAVLEPSAPSARSVKAAKRYKEVLGL
jgi:uncharacterized protein (DUF1778 family)